MSEMDIVAPFSAPTSVWCAGSSQMKPTTQYDTMPPPAMACANDKHDHDKR